MSQCKFERESTDEQIHFCVADAGHNGDHTPYDKSVRFVSEWRERQIPFGATRHGKTKAKRKAKEPTNA